jgi:hypothetical protein
MPQQADTEALQRVEQIAAIRIQQRKRATTAASRLQPKQVEVLMSHNTLHDKILFATENTESTEKVITRMRMASCRLSRWCKLLNWQANTRITTNFSVYSVISVARS